MSTHVTRLALILRLTLLASLLSLGAAFVAQYGFGLAPCHLCYAQRVPFALVILAALYGLRHPQARVRLVFAVGLLFLINSGIAAYHTAVEQHVVSGPTGCTNGPTPDHQSMDDFLKHIESAPIVACDQPQWEYHGLTMASLNAIWCLFLGIATFAALQYSFKREKRHAQAAG